VDTRLGLLDTLPALTRPDLLAAPVAQALAALDGTLPADEVRVAEIDAAAADTAEFCRRYEVAPDESANCVVISGRRGGDLRYAACVLLATTRADVNAVVRRELNVRKASFAPMDDAVEQTGMEYGGITPVGLPPEWLLLVDSRVLETSQVVIGSGVRRSKLVLPGAALARLPGARVKEGLGRAASA
jgi:prolyl-tRNA editing enzyme YbaK/EbsC (Cys-tRNA(Pro) deacylase)